MWSRYLLVTGILLGMGLLGSRSGQAQDAKALRAQANAESNQERQVQLLCKAADLEPNNKEFRKDCDVSRNALISSDKQALKTALEANEAGLAAKARRYAKYVSSLDPETHRQAEQLLARLNAPDAAPGNAGNSPPPTAPPSAPNQSAALAQALTLYENGGLQAARTTAQGITDPTVKPAANRILADIDRYTGYVGAGQRHEQAKDYEAAASSYQAALDLNAHVGADDLAGKILHMRSLATAQQSGPLVAAKGSQKTPIGKPPPELSPDEKKKRLLDESAQAMARNDLDTAGRKFKQVLDIDPANADAKRGLGDITALLSRDPIRLEKTLREAITAFYTSHFEDAESRLNRYLGADGGKKKGAAYFYLGATEATLSFLEDASRRTSRTRQAQDDFKQARSAGYQPVEKYVSARVLEVWKGSGI